MYVDKEDMLKCRDKGINCSYGICDECMVVNNPEELEEELDIMPKEVREYFKAGIERED